MYPVPTSSLSRGQLGTTWPKSFSHVVPNINLRFCLIVRNSVFIIGNVAQHERSPPP
jgi:hypothetical protein